jgi:nitrate/nitrite transporter NarK
MLKETRPLWTLQQGRTFFGAEPRETNRRVLCVDHNFVIWFFLSPLSCSLACNPFELAPKVIHN